MKMITFSGPPSAGKTSVILKTIRCLKEQQMKLGVVKFDCLYTDDDKIYERNDIPVKKGLSGTLCPDHYFVSNIDEIIRWGKELSLDMLITESAGLCNRCSPYIRDVLSICVIDNLAGINTPLKIGPMLRSADIVVITKGDIVSQAEREIFASRVQTVNPRAAVIHINGLSGQGAFELASYIDRNAAALADGQEMKLRYPMPTALCSYCLGETRIGADYQLGNVRKIQ